MGSCQNYAPFLGTLNIRCRIIIRTQKGTIIFDNHPYTIPQLICKPKLPGPDALLNPESEVPNPNPQTLNPKDPLGIPLKEPL